MKITREQVDYVALLGRLELEPEEKEKYMGQLDDILKYMDMLAEDATDDVGPMAGPWCFTLHCEGRSQAVASRRQDAACECAGSRRHILPRSQGERRTKRSIKPDEE